MNDRIEKGDIVTVDFTASMSIHKAKVLRAPNDVGDCWTLDCVGQIINVVLFERMTRIQKGKPMVVKSPLTITQAEELR